MKPVRTALISGLVLVSVVSLLTGVERNVEKTEADSKPIKLTGIFDPYECRDTNVTNAVVMKPQPKCGECHASAVLSPNAQLPRLELTVAHGRTTNSWVFTGQPKDGQIVFEKGKFHMTYSDGCLKGAYKGKMNARIELKAEK
ncbi:MAG: hypothetical protein NT105_08220 [Verrucomicrobia bacterium]|nr:hypothetical protein [Verrucomicrobiota bacterium]